MHWLATHSLSELQVSSLVLLWFLSCFLWWELSKCPHYKSHHTAMLANVTSDNTAASSCCLSSKTVLTSDASFPICGSVARYFVNAENLNWRGKQNKQAFSRRTGTPVGQLLSPVWSCQRNEQQKLRVTEKMPHKRLQSTTLSCSRSAVNFTASVISLIQTPLGPIEKEMFYKNLRHYPSSFHCKFTLFDLYGSDTIECAVSLWLFVHIIAKINILFSENIILLLWSTWCWFQPSGRTISPVVEKWPPCAGWDPWTSETT